MTIASNSEWEVVVVAATAVNNSTVAFEATAGDKPAASVAESVAHTRATDFDCWEVTVASKSRPAPGSAGSCSAASAVGMLVTPADRIQDDSPAAKIFGMATGAVVARAPEDRRVAVARRTSDKPGTEDGSAGMA